MAGDMNRFAMQDNDDYYTLVGEQGLCLVGDAIVNLGKVAMIRLADGKTLVYRGGAAEPIALPAEAFEVIRDAVFAIDDYDDDESDDDMEDGEEE